MGVAIKIPIQANMYAQVKKFLNTRGIWGIQADPISKRCV
jgi:hypothetical protein